MTAHRSVSRAVTAALTAAPPEDRDAGAVALTRQYAALIDDAAPAAKYRKPLELLGRAAAVYAEGLDDRDAQQLHEAFQTIRTALSSHSVASDLGPKLLAALTALGLTVAGRAGKIKETPGADPVVPGQAERDEIRARRARRQRNAAAVDPSAS